jgi:hypothetical protein
MWENRWHPLTVQKKRVPNGGLKEIEPEIPDLRGHLFGKKGVFGQALDNLLF